VLRRLRWRPTATVHLGEEGVSAVRLQARNRHHDPRTLARYAKPGIEAVATLTANTTEAAANDRDLSRSRPLAQAVICAHSGSANAAWVA
jgi:hypothetical protein